MIVDSLVGAYCVGAIWACLTVGLVTCAALYWSDLAWSRDNGSN